MNTQTFQPNIPGVYHGLPMSVYRQAPGVANSTLQHVNPPARCLHHLTQPPEDPTVDMVLGTLLHDAILRQPSQAIAVPPETYPSAKDGPKPWNFNAHYCQDWRRDQQEAGRIVLKQAQLDEVNGCIRAILARPECAAIFAAGDAEVSVFTRRDPPGILTKHRVDWVPRSTNYLVDIKKVSQGNAEPVAFAKLAVERGYHRQAHGYITGWNAETGPADKREHMAFIVVESEPPHLVSIVYLDAATMESARVTYEARLAKFAECEKTGVWPGYGTGYQFPVTPAYALARDQ